MKLLPSVLAHTGNDAVNHSFGIAEGIISIIIIGILILVIWLIKKQDANVSHPALEETKNIISIEKEVKKKWIRNICMDF